MPFKALYYVLVALFLLVAGLVGGAYQIAEHKKREGDE